MKTIETWTDPRVYHDSHEHPYACRIFTGGMVVCDVAIRAGYDKRARLISAAPKLLDTLIQAVEASGFSLSGPTDVRAAEHGEPAWVCNARGIIAKATT